MLHIGINEYLYPSEKIEGRESHEAPWEKIMLGLILFIPGSYHTFAAFMACNRMGEFTYDDVCAFESDDWHDKDD